MDYDDETGRAVLVRDELYDYDALPTVQPTPAPDEEADRRNAEQFAILMDYLIREDAPIIEVFTNIGAMLLDGISVEAGQHFGKLAQEIYVLERGIIERRAGIEKG